MLQLQAMDWHAPSRYHGWCSCTCIPIHAPPPRPTPPTSPRRFDRELLFPLPNLSARGDILRIHTRKWAQPPSPQLVEELATLCVGYCGADLKVGGV